MPEDLTEYSDEFWQKLFNALSEIGFIALESEMVDFIYVLKKKGLEIKEVKTIKVTGQ